MLEVTEQRPINNICKFMNQQTVTRDLKCGICLPGFHTKDNLWFSESNFCFFLEFFRRFWKGQGNRLKMSSILTKPNVITERLWSCQIAIFRPFALRHLNSGTVRNGSPNNNGTVIRQGQGMVNRGASNHAAGLAQLESLGISRDSPVVADDLIRRFSTLRRAENLFDTLSVKDCCLELSSQAGDNLKL